MWKKDETPKAPPARSEDEKPSPAPVARSSGAALVGASLVVEGSIKGQEDLLVEGQIEGDVALPKNTVTVGQSGRVNATIEAKVIIVEGRVEGDLKGAEQVEIRQSGHVLGNIIAPRVGLEDGAQFKGNIDMSPKGRSDNTPPKYESAPSRSDSKPSFSASEPSKSTPDQSKNEQVAGPTADKKLPG